MRFLAALFFASSLALAITQQEAIEAIQQNPSLLETPEAKAIMAQRGITKAQVEQKVLGTSKTEEISTSAPFSNVIESDDQNKSFLGKEELLLQSDLENPLLYHANEVIINKIRAKQLEAQKTELQRFGENFFFNKNPVDPSSLPTPDYYILTAGDELSVWVYGSTNENYSLAINNEGNINIPVLGPLHVGGMEFGKARELISSFLAKSHPNAQVLVSISKYSTIQVTLTGEAKAPGLYNLHSLSTVKDLLVTAQGMLPTGSMRNVLIKRNGKVIDSIDFYELIKNGNSGVDKILRAGDVVHIPPKLKEVKLYGYVRNPAIYELKEGERLADLMRFSGGLLPNASQYGFRIKRFEGNEKIKTIEIDYTKSTQFPLNDGDEIYVYNLDENQHEKVYIYGNVLRPGAKELSEKTDTLGKLLSLETSKSLESFFLDNTLFDYALIKRVGPDLSPVILSVNLADIMAKKTDIKLKKNDEIYILNRLDAYSNPYVTIDGSVLRSGKYQYIKGMSLSDLVHAAGMDGIIDKNIRVVTYQTKDFLPQTTVVNLDQNGSYQLNPFDEVHVFGYYETTLIPKASIEGEVIAPGTYPIDKNTSLQDLIRAAGGVTDKASMEKIEIIRYDVVQGVRERKIIHISKNDLDRGPIFLQNYDEIKIFRIPKWSEKKRVTINGQVLYPGTYTIEEGDRLSDLIKRAGGFTKEAFLRGTVFMRESIKQIQDRELKKSIATLRKKAALLAAEPTQAGEKSEEKSRMLQVIDGFLKEADGITALGRISVNIPSKMDELEKCSSNIPLENNDTIYIPMANHTVSVLGEVFNPTSIIFRDGEDVWEYIEKAGGLTDNADSSNIYIVKANGEAQRVSSSGFFVTSSSTVDLGDTIIVPPKIETVSGIEVAKDVTAIIYQLAVSVSALKTIGVF